MPPVPRSFIREYAWWVAKNTLGWVLIAASPIVGAAVPGPGGLPMFIVGFALVSFPGKRNLTARVFRGIPIDTRGNAAGVYSGIGAILLPLALALLLKIKLDDELELKVLRSPLMASGVIASILASFLLLRLSLRAANVLLRRLPRLRRAVRPAMRRRGVHLLPPRRRRRLSVTQPNAVNGSVDQTLDQEILAIDPAVQAQAKTLCRRVAPWLKRALWLAVMIAVFYYMLRPVRGHWADVRDRILHYDPWRFIIATGMFSVFLMYRCLTWLKMIKGFGHRVPLAAGTRIWSTGELARYLPGTIWQVLGRVYLIKPYGVPPAVCSTTQILDIATFLLANIVLGLSCVLWFFGRPAAGNDDMRPYLIGAALFVPLLAFGLHPKVFYTLTNRILTRAKKQPFATRLHGAKLLKYFCGYLLALLWQSAAIYVLLGAALHIAPSHWWQLAGPYSIAWSAGFVVGWWSPGGLGVREVVFVGLLNMTLGPQAQALFPDAPTRLGFLVFCSVLLRLWTIAGELTLASIAYALDSRALFGSRPAITRPA